MKINEFNYYFTLRQSKDIAITMGAIYNDLAYCKIDKNKISQIYNLNINEFKRDIDLHDIESQVQNKNEDEKEKLLKMCKQLQTKWDNYRKEYYDIISNIFEIELDYNETSYNYCYLHFLPINEYDLKDNNIYLDCGKSVDDVFKTFIITLTKAILINRWNYVNKWKFDNEFDLKSKIWMFAEIAIDAVFANSNLHKICDKPSYKYLYSLSIGEVNSLQYFRDYYTTVKLDDFFTEVYMFVHGNYKKILQFNHYLY